MDTIEETTEIKTEMLDNLISSNVEIKYLPLMSNDDFINIFCPETITEDSILQPKYIYQDVYSHNPIPSIITLNDICITKKILNIPKTATYIAISKYNIKSIYLSPKINHYNANLFTDRNMVFLVGYSNEITRYIYYYLKNNISSFLHINNIINIQLSNSQLIDEVLISELMRLQIPNITLEQLDNSLEEISKSVEAIDIAESSITTKEKEINRMLKEIKTMEKDINVAKILIFKHKKKLKGKYKVFE